MDLRHLLWEVRDRVGFLTVNRPQVRNALNAEAIAEMGRVLDLACADPAVGVLVLSGAGDKAFVAGADIRELAEQAPVQGREFALAGQRVLARLETLGKPSIAAVNGFALGGGCELALACSIRIAANTARFGQPEVNLGIIPGYGGTQRLARLVGPGHALDLILTGRLIGAEEALRLGLVSRVIPPADLLPAAEEIARTLLEKGPIALRYAMEAVRRGLQMPLAEGLHLEATLFGLLCATEDMREGTRAFAEKRAPAFHGR